jgi:hypothetical protein
VGWSALFVPGEFVDWLEGQPEHEVYDAFFGQGDAHAAREHRIALARRMASGIRISAERVERKTKSVTVNVQQRAPALISPIDGRTQGGGYVAFDAGSPEHVAELRRQGIRNLASWIQRYAIAFSEAELEPLRELAGVPVQKPDAA